MSARSDFEKLIAILGDPHLAEALDEAQWSVLVCTARNSNLLGALAECLEDAQITAPPPATRHLEGARQLSRRQRQSVVWEAYQLQRALAGLKVPVLLLKGAAYVMSQDLVAKGRTFGDVDILVPRPSVGDVESQLMLSGWVSAKTDPYDQRYYRQWMHEIPPMTHIRRDTTLDVHHTILPLTARNAPDPAQIIARSLPIAKPGLDTLRVPCPEDLVIHSITHLVHEGELHNGLRDLRDIDSMLRHFPSSDDFWTRLVQYSAGNDLAQPVLLGLHLARQVFGTPIPGTVFDELTSAGNSKTPDRFLVAIYTKALQPVANDEPDFLAVIARSLIYVRSHALRMPLPQLARHLSTKAWMGWRNNFRHTEKD